MAWLNPHSTARIAVDLNQFEIQAFLNMLVKHASGSHEVHPGMILHVCEVLPFRIL